MTLEILFKFKKVRGGGDTTHEFLLAMDGGRTEPSNIDSMLERHMVQVPVQGFSTTGDDCEAVINFNLVENDIGLDG